MGASNWPYVINLGNSIIGVSILAMPFCFKQCGLLLGPLLLMSCAFLTHLSCKLLMKGALGSRRRSYEFLAFHTFGYVGKLAVELSIIGLLLGTCIAFYVIIGDLGPAIFSKITGFANTSNLRTSLMVGLGTCVALPLSMLKNVESLSHISAVSLGFYCVFLLSVFFTAIPNMYSGMWVNHVTVWEWQGAFKCLPIFSLAYACQTQLFVMYDALPEPSLNRMTTIAKNAITMCTIVYFCVGFFGYIAFYQEEVMGDILMNFRPTIFTGCVKIGFVISVAVSFPLVIFPCRASLYTLLFSKDPGHHDGLQTSIYIPPLHFKGLTVAVVFLTMIIGILIPNIEFVLAMTGATMGSMICFIFPAVTYISVASVAKGPNSKSTAQIVLFLGITLLFASTYITLNTNEDAAAAENIADIAKNIQQNENKDEVVVHEDSEVEEKKEVDGLLKDPGKDADSIILHDAENEGAGGINPIMPVVEEKRQEPPNPQAPPDSDEKEGDPDAVAVQNQNQLPEQEIEKRADEQGIAVVEEARDVQEAVAGVDIQPVNPVADVEINQVVPENPQPVDNVPVMKPADVAVNVPQGDAGVQPAEPAEAAEAAVVTAPVAPVIRQTVNAQPVAVVDPVSPLVPVDNQPAKGIVQKQQDILPQAKVDAPLAPEADHHHEEEIAQLKNTNEETKQLLKDLKDTQQENIKLINEQKQMIQELHDEKKFRQQQDQQPQQQQQPQPQVEEVQQPLNDVKPDNRVINANIPPHEHVTQKQMKANFSKKSIHSHKSKKVPNARDDI